MQQAVPGGYFHPGNVAQQPAKADGHQQQRLELFRNCQVQQHEADDNHRELTAGNLRQSRSCPKLIKKFQPGSP